MANSNDKLKPSHNSKGFLVTLLKTETLTGSKSRDGGEGCKANGDRAVTAEASRPEPPLRDSSDFNCKSVAVSRGSWPWPWPEWETTAPCPPTPPPHPTPPPKRRSLRGCDPPPSAAAAPRLVTCSWVDARLHEGRLHDLEPPEELGHEHQVIALRARVRVLSPTTQWFCVWPQGVSKGSTNSPSNSSL